MICVTCRVGMKYLLLAVGMTNNMFYARLLNRVCVCVCVLLHEYDYIGTIGCNWGCLNVIPHQR